MLSSYERAIQYEVNAFYGMSKFNYLLKIFALEYGRVWRKSDFSNINLYYKNIAKNGPNNDFLEPKMVSDLVFGGFSCISMVCIIQNPKIPRGYPILGNIRQKLGRFCLIFPKIRKIPHIFGFWMVQTMAIHEKPPKTRSKTIFGSRKSPF